MIHFAKKSGILFLASTFLFACAEDDRPVSFGQMDEARLQLDNAAHWYAGGRTVTGGHYSPLDHIHDHNVSTLGKAWEYNAKHAFQAPPLVLDGVMYARDASGAVHAINAATGQALWQFQPEGPAEKFRCCDVEADALLIWLGHIYTFSPAGRLIALNAATGTHVWTGKDKYTAIGGMQIAADHIIVAGKTEQDTKNTIRGHDPANGTVVWSLHVARDSNTSSPAEFANVVHDPETGILYTATGSSALSSKQAIWDTEQTDIIPASAIVAIKAQTGDVLWTYKSVPDSLSGQAIPVTLATLAINETPAKVVIQAGADGNFHIIDAANGRQISARTYGGPEIIRSASHMSYHERSGLAYIPVTVSSETAPGAYALAWDPLEGKEKVRIAIDTDDACGGGLVSTSGHLLLQGDRNGYLNIYSIDGWYYLAERVYVGSCITHSPVTYALNKTQFISVTTITSGSNGAITGGKITSLKLGGLRLGADREDRKAYLSKVIYPEDE